MYCRTCGTQMNETMPCPNCGWQKNAAPVVAPDMTYINAQQTQYQQNRTQQSFTHKNNNDCYTQYVPDGEAINIQADFAFNNTQYGVKRQTQPAEQQVKQPVKHQLVDIYHDIKSSRTVNNFILRIRHLKESGNIPQLIIYLIGIGVRLAGCILFAFSFSNIVQSIPELIVTLLSGKYLIFLLILSIIFRYVSKFMGGSEQFRETQSYKKYNPIISKILNVCDIIVLVWCFIDFASALLSFAAGYEAYNYMSSLF